MSESETPRPSKRPVVYKSKKQIKEAWAKLDFPDLEDNPTPTEEHSALDKLYQDDIHGLGNE